MQYMHRKFGIHIYVLHTVINIYNIYNVIYIQKFKIKEYVYIYM